MKNDDVTRFSGAEIAYHWAQGIPYLVLFVSGAMMLLQRLLEVELVSRRVLSLVHRFTGLTLIVILGQTLLVIVVRGRWSALWGTLREALSWRASDLVWLAKAPLHALAPRVRLPRVGRFNPGQKIHVFMIVGLVTGFVGSGLAIMLAPGALGPWMIHLALFVPACGLIVVHLFLALVNPPTRQALGGIFHGRVSAEYAREHHPLWFGREAPAVGPHALVSRWAVLGSLAVGVLAVAAAVGLYGPARLKLRTAEVWAGGGRQLIEPGLLCDSHARDPGVNRCGACHVLWQRPPSQKCLDCHTALAAIIADRRGYHGVLAGECRQCHGEHAGRDADIRPFDQQAFQHDLARYRLEGKHRDLTCPTCHFDEAEAGPGRMRYTGLRFDRCTDCHANPHDEPAADVCERCHLQQGWRRPLITFDHNRDSDYALDGAHAVTPCDRCHRKATGSVAAASFQVYGLGTRCADCHEDPHRASLGATCDRCHTTVAWGQRALKFDHARDTTYPLAAGHAAVACAKCHVPPEGGTPGQAKFAGLDTRCASCHTDPHAGQFEGACSTCHRLEGWRRPNLLYAHNRDGSYALDAVHARAACESCHQGKPVVVYRDTPTQCDRCHGHAKMSVDGVLGGGPRQPDPHAGRVACDQCHDMTRPRPKLADYARACVRCHNERYEGLLYDWARSLEERRTRAEKRTAELTERDDPRAADLGRHVREARVIGLHNVQQARRMYDEILGAPPPSEPQSQ